MLRRQLLLGSASLACQVPLGSARAQETWPARPIRILVGTSPGGPNDLAARAAGQMLADGYRASVVVENRTGAGGTIAANLTARAPADGYTLFMGSEANMCIAPHLYAGQPYDPVRDFSAISMIGRFSFVAVVHPSVPARSIAELIALAKARPGKLSYGSAGVGTVTYLAAELFKIMAGVDITHVPYKGAAPAMVDLVGGHLEVMFDSVITSAPQIEAGTIRALGQSGRQRAPQLPDVPTIAEGGVPGYECATWVGLVGPANMSASVVARLNATIAGALATPEVRDPLVKGGLEPESSTPERLAAQIRADFTKWEPVLKTIGLKRE